MPVFDHFEWVAPYYERVIHPHDAESLIELLGLPIRGLLLDAGGGTGRVSQMLVGQADAILVADASYGMLHEAGKKTGITGSQMMTEALAFPDNLFERIIMVDALHHVADQRQTACELLRVLKPGGRLVIEEPDIRTLGVRLLAILEKLVLMRSHFLSPGRMAQLFANSEARTRIVWEGYLAWVIVDKML